MWWTKTGKPSVNAGDLTAFIDEGSEIEGQCTFGGTVMLNGTVRGEATCTDTVIIGEKGIAHTTIRAGAIVISGPVVGNLMAPQRVAMRVAARVCDAIAAPVVVMMAGVT